MNALRETFVSRNSLGALGHLAPMSNKKSSPVVKPSVKTEPSHGALTLLLAEGASAAPEWVHLLEAGANVTNDGRGPFIAKDIPAIIAKSLANSVDGKLPIDVNHSIDVAAPNGGPSPAVGWIVELQSRDDGLWGKVEWTPEGIRLLADKAYRFLSPVLFHEQNVVTWVARASLVNWPALHGLAPVLNSNQPNTEFDIMEFLKALLAILGLPETTEQDAALASVKALQTDKVAVLASVAKAAGVDEAASQDVVLLAVKNLKDPAKFVPADQVAVLSAQLDKLVKATAKEKAELCIDAAIAAGKVGVKPLRQHYIDRHIVDAASVEAELAVKPCLNSGSLVQPRVAADGAVLLSAEELEVSKQLNISPEAMIKTKAAIEAQKENA
jgi:phage I-like protein